MGTLVLTVFLSLFSWLHPVHVSLLNIDMEPDTGNIKMVFKFFSDDFENIIFQRYNVQLNITQQIDPGKKIEAINRYIDDSFEISINGNNISNLEYTGNKMDELAIWLYYQYNYPGQIKSVSIKNEVMMDLFDDQTNLVIITYHDKQNGYRLNNKKRNIEFSIDQP
jgi:hypothetical protein